MADSTHIVPFILQKEGGLSRDPNDTASKHPAPCPYKGYTGWHTNKGITYDTFISNAETLGYNDSCDTFYSMPTDVWTKIYKSGYWDKLQLDKLKSQALADVIVNWAWGSGNGAAYLQLKKFVQKNSDVTLGSYNTANVTKLITVLNALTDKNEQLTLSKLVDQYKTFLKSLKQPKFEKGWLNRVDDIVKYSWGAVLSHPGISLTTAGIIFGGLYWWIKGRH